jgi:hypothetical protein
MPATLEMQELQDEQENDSELQDLLDEGNNSLKLQKLSTDATASIYCDTLLATSDLIFLHYYSRKSSPSFTIHRIPQVKQYANNCCKNTYGQT